PAPCRRPSSTPPPARRRTPRPPTPTLRWRPRAPVAALRRRAPRRLRRSPAVRPGRARQRRVSGPDPRSSQCLLVGAMCPFAERLVGLAVGEPTPYHSFDVVGQLGGT